MLNEFEGRWAMVTVAVDERTEGGLADMRECSMEVGGIDNVEEDTAGPALV